MRAGDPARARSCLLRGLPSRRTAVSSSHLKPQISAQLHDLPRRRRSQRQCGFISAIVANSARRMRYGLCRPAGLPDKAAQGSRTEKSRTSGAEQATRFRDPCADAWLRRFCRRRPASQPASTSAGERGIGGARSACAWPTVRAPDGPARRSCKPSRNRRASPRPARSAAGPRHAVRDRDRRYGWRAAKTDGFSQRCDARGAAGLSRPRRP
ncbi:hypothetical protein C7405_12097 [Paraburkholderia caballeronis]|nr:hypothetical protein C7405_12097 [Paraburkholderia caballeronis]